jgi:hypothetical protein
VWAPDKELDSHTNCLIDYSASGKAHVQREI